MPIVLASNHYGKSRVRLVKVTRHSDRHDLKELTVHISLEGDFDSAHMAGDNSKILPTDTMKNTVYALAKDHPVDQIEGFALRLGEHFLKTDSHVTKALIEIHEHLWSRVSRHTFLGGKGERRTAKIIAGRGGVAVESGVDDLLLLNTTGSGFEGFMRDRYTTLKETSDRIMASSIRASWVYASADVPFGLCWHGVRQTLIDTFAEHKSRSVQHTLYAMGETVLKVHEDVTEIHLSMPNKHCLLVDLAPFGLENRNEIFLPIDEPHGLIEATLKKT